MIGQLDDAWQDSVPHQSNSWGWKWLLGLLARRRGDMVEAKEAFEAAHELAQGEYKVKCASALARLADKAADYGSAYQWAMETVELRAGEVNEMKSNFPLSEEMTELPENQNSGASIKSAQRPLIFLTGMPRAGTTLLAHQLANHFSIDLSEEYDYIKQLVDNAALQKRPVSPDKLVGKFSNKKHIAAYWKAQFESGLTEQANSSKPLLDKNPSLALLTPWLLALFPSMKILWLERDPRDLWISSVMLDVPVNGATCWWQTPDDYGKWGAQHADLRDRLESTLPPDQFIKVDYRDLVSQPETVILDIGGKFSLTPNINNEVSQSVITSPSYEEVIKPITKNRLVRWENYRPLLSPEDQEAFDQLPERYGYTIS